MTLTFGAVLPTAFGALAAFVGSALYLYVYPLDYTLDQILDAHCLKTNAIVITLRNRNSFPHVVDLGGRDLFPRNSGITLPLRIYLRTPQIFSPPSFQYPP